MIEGLAGISVPGSGSEDDWVRAFMDNLGYSEDAARQLLRYNIQRQREAEGGSTQSAS